MEYVTHTNQLNDLAHGYDTGDYNSRVYTELYSLTQAVVCAALEDASTLCKDPDFRALPDGSNLYERLDALDALHKDIATIIEDFSSDMKHLFGNYSTDRHCNTSTIPNMAMSSACEISKIRDAMQEFIDIAQLTHSVILLKIETALKALDTVNDQRINCYCMHPNSLYLPFINCLEILPLTVNGKVLLCGLYNRTLSNKLQTFYQKVNEILLTNGLADTAPVTQETTSIQRIPLLTNEPDAETMECLSTGEFFQPVDAHSWVQSDYDRPKVCESEITLSDLIENELTDPDDNDVLHQGYFTVPQDSELDQLFEPYGPGSGSSSTPHQRDQVIFALSHVQRKIADGVGCPDTEEIQNSIKQYLYESGCADANNLVENEIGVFEFVNSVFEKILDDDGLQICIKNLVTKLHIPVIKLAIVDFEFFKNPLHPTRILLNRLTSVSIGVQNTQDSLYIRLHRIVNSILKEFETDPSVFEHALQQINSIDLYTSEQSLRVEANTQRNAKIKSRRSAARLSVIKVVNRYLKGRTLPDEIQEYCLNCWAPHLGLLYLYQGTRSGAWASSVNSLRKVIEVAKPGRTIVEIEHITGGAEGFFTYMHNQLEQVSDIARSNSHIFTRAENWYKQLLADQIAIAHKLQKTAQSVADECKETSEESPSDTVVRFISEIENTNESDDASDDVLDILQAIPPEVIPGAWFEIYRGENRSKRRLKLSAILKDTGRLLFSDRSGIAAMEIDISPFLIDLNEKRTQLIDESNRFDNALSSVISSIRDSQHKQAVL